MSALGQKRTFARHGMSACRNARCRDGEIEFDRYCRSPKETGQASLRTASKGPLIQAFAIDFQRLSCSAINSARRRSSFPSRMPMSSGSARQ